MHPAGTGRSQYRKKDNEEDYGTDQNEKIRCDRAGKKDRRRDFTGIPAGRDRDGDLYTGAGYGIESGNDADIDRITHYLCVIAVLAFVLSLYASQTFTRPIRQISDAMTSFDGNDFTHTIQIHTDTELDKIGHAYNEMLKNIEEFQNEVKNQQKELRISEMNTLISQINPHFLYNTGYHLYAGADQRGREDDEDDTGTVKVSASVTE